jgi:hypothetical protein
MAILRLLLTYCTQSDKNVHSQNYRADLVYRDRTYRMITVYITPLGTQ